MKSLKLFCPRQLSMPHFYGGEAKMFFIANNKKLKFCIYLNNLTFSALMRSLAFFTNKLEIRSFAS